MPTGQNSFYGFRLLPLLLLWVFLVSCGSRDNLVGIYKAEEKNLPKPLETLIELKLNGEGAWKVGEEEVPFSWYTKGDELRINTKGGGVIVGYIEKGLIRTTIPGTPEMTFKKIQ
jgi:hypothetical protein